MADEREVTITIRGKNLTEPEFNKARTGIAAIAKEATNAKTPVSLFGGELERASAKASHSESALSGVSGVFGKFTAATVAGNLLVRFGDELLGVVKRSEQLARVEGSFERLAFVAGSSSSQMLTSMKAGSLGLVSNYDLISAANKALLLGLPVTATEMGDLARTATVLGRAMGQDASASLNDLITALGRSSPMILDNLGLTVKVSEANERYAEKLGITGRELTEAEKKMAFYVEAMRKARERTSEVGEQTLTLGEQAQRAWKFVSGAATGAMAAVNREGGALIGGFESAASSVGSFFHGLSTGGIRSVAAMAGVNQGLANVVRSAVAAAATPPVSPTSVRLVQEMREKVAALTAEQRKEIEAARVLGDDALKKVGQQYGLNAGHLKILEEQTRKQSAADERMAKANREVQASLIPLTASQKSSVLAMRENNVATSTMAITLGVAEVQISRYLERADNAKEITKKWADVQKEWEKITRESVEKSTAALIKGAQDEARVRGASQDAQLRALVQFSEKNRQLALSGTELKLRQIEVEEAAVIASLGEQRGEHDKFYGMSREQIEAYYQHEKDLALGTSGTIVERMRAAGVSTRADLQATADRARRDYEQMAASSGQFSDATIAHFKRIAEQAKREADGTADHWRRVASAFGHVGEIADLIPGKLGQIAQIATKAGEAIAARLASGDVWGAVVAGVTAGVNALKVLFGGATEYEKRMKKAVEETAKLQDELVKSHGGMAQLIIDADMVGINIKEAFKWKDNPEAFKKIVSEIDEKTRKLNDAMKEYGFTWEDTATRFRNAKLATLFEEIFEKTQLLRGAGIDYTTILERQADDYSKLLQAAKRTGTEIPDSMRPVLEDLLRMGKLVDENGNAFTDLGDVSWSVSMTKGFQQVGDAMREVGQTIKTAIEDVLERIAKKVYRPKIEPEIEEEEEPEADRLATSLRDTFVNRDTNVIPFRRERATLSSDVRTAVSQSVSAAAPVVTLSDDRDIVIHQTVVLDGRVIDERTERIAKRLAAIGALRTRDGAGRSY